MATTEYVVVVECKNRKVSKWFHTEVPVKTRKGITDSYLGCSDRNVGPS